MSKTNVTMETTKAIEKLEQAKSVLLALTGAHSVTYNVTASVSEAKYAYSGTVVINNEGQHTKTNCDFTDFVNLLKANNLDEDYKPSINEACTKARQTYNKNNGLWAIYRLTNVKNGTLGTNSKYDIVHYAGDSNTCYNAIIDYLSNSIDILKSNRQLVNSSEDLAEVIDIAHLKKLLQAFLMGESVKSNSTHTIYKRLRQLKPSNKLFTIAAKELSSCAVAARNGIGKNGNSFTLNKNSVKAVITNMIATYIVNQMSENALYNEVYKALEKMESQKRLTFFEALQEQVKSEIDAAMELEAKAKEDAEAKAKLKAIAEAKAKEDAEAKAKLKALAEAKAKAENDFTNAAKSRVGSFNYSKSFLYNCDECYFLDFVKTDFLNGGYGCKVKYYNDTTKHIEFMSLKRFIRDIAEVARLPKLPENEQTFIKFDTNSVIL